MKKIFLILTLLIFAIGGQIHAEQEFPALPDPEGSIIILDLGVASDAAPVGVPDAYSTFVNTRLTVAAPGVLANDEGSNLSVKTFTNPQNGVLELFTNGAFDYTPDTGFSGTDTFKYRATNGTLDGELTTVTITISGQNTPPVANPDSYNAQFNTPLNIPAPGLLANDTDPDDQTLIIETATSPAHGTLQMFNNGAFIYTPNTGFSGEDGFTYRVTDGTVVSNFTTVTIIVLPEGLALLSPRGQINVSYGNPLYTWAHRGASNYEIYLAAGDDIYAAKAWETISASNYCTADLCSVDLTKITGTAWLVNGTYQVWLYSAADDWQGPFFFSINATAPGLVTSSSVQNVDNPRPTITWTLTGSATRSSWFQVYLAPTNDLNNAVNIFPPINGQWWISREDACGSYDSVNCAITPQMNLMIGTNYSFYLQGWNPGGLTVGGIGNSGWALLTDFTVAQ